MPPASITQTTVLLCRHGQTSWNQSGRLQGQLDTDLDATGRAQAERLGAALATRMLRLPLAATVYSSDQKRASDTASACIAACFATAATPPEHRSDARLRERALGPFQGLTEREAAESQAGAWGRFLRGLPTEGVEADGEIEARAAAALRDIAHSHPGQTVLVFSHGGTIHAAICVLAGAAEMPHIGNCSVSELSASEGHGPELLWEVVSVGEAPVPASRARNVDVKGKR